MNKRIIIVIIAVIAVVAIGVTVFFINKQNSEKAMRESLETFIGYINEKNYDEMYNMLSESSKSEISKDDFVKRNKNIYEGIDAVNLKVDVSELSKENGVNRLKYTESMVTSAGSIEFENTAKIVKENKEYKINWSSSMIFPELRDTDKVRISTIKSSRGEILDRNGVKLAENGQISTVGIVPGKLGENRDASIAKISELTGVSQDYINKQISASYVKDDTFVPIKKVAKNATELKEKLFEIAGIKINSTDARVYSLGEEAAHLIGYVQAINAEELEENEGKGYSSTSVIGKAGLEKAYEDKLRGIDGIEIYIEDEDGNKLKQLAKQDKKDGEDVKLTIDSKVQKQFYDELKNDKGLFVVMNPSTGELLATVSTPSFNSNDFILGMTTDKWNELNNDTNKPLYNRFAGRYCPGSTFKPITAAIGLATGKLTNDTTFSYSGLKWQKDSSWGNHFVTTLTAYSGAKNIKNAIIHSDNIFFAQAAMQIGSETFCKGLNEIGFDEQVEFPLSLQKSKYSNSDKIETEIKLADSGFGQGDILVNPIHMASIYSAFANDGNMVKPYIEYKEKAKKEYLKENAFTKEAVNSVKEDMIQVVENTEGTANDMKINGLTIAGKTGTAELKTSSDDTESGTFGWFNCFTTNRAGNDLLIVGMVENVQDNSAGGSHYVIKKIKNCISK